MKKYYQIFIVSLQEMFVWKTNFVLWRVRNVFALLLLFFLWSTVFAKQDVLFGYDRPQILTYVLGISLLRSFVLSSRSIDLAGEIHDGRLTNFLLRPISYIRWWGVRDTADKLVNILFSIVELSALWLIFKPILFFQTNPGFILLTVAAGILATVLYFYFSFLLSLAAFWLREVWGIRFIAMVVIDFLAGGFFPLDILPAPLFTVLQLTPFPYILFFPVKIYLGQLGLTTVISGLCIMIFWIVTLVMLTNFVWMRGLRVYSADRQ